MTRDPGPDAEQAKRIMEQVPQEPIAADPSENDEADDRPEDDDNGPDPGPGCRSATPLRRLEDEKGKCRQHTTRPEPVVAPQLCPRCGGHLLPIVRFSRRGGRAKLLRCRECYYIQCRECYYTEDAPGVDPIPPQEHGDNCS